MVALSLSLARKTDGMDGPRIYVGKDQETGLCKGFGFVSFEDRSDAEAAMKKVHGLPYDHLILQVQWSVPKEQRTDAGPGRG